ncbi:MAG: 50S ribosomal protein L9 [Clostridiales bacterium]|nr:50S ribosomal protein L9 [Clostridiales bacterium]
MKVILQQDVKGHGKKGQTVDVSDGYARNYLIPRKLALPATAHNINTAKQQERSRLRKIEQEKQTAEELVSRLEGLVVKITARAGEGGRLFGSVTSAEISEELQKQHGVTIEKNKLVLEDHIKAFGTYTVRCKLGHEISGAVNVVVTEG